MSTRKEYRIVRIPKRGGGTRPIYVPTKKRRAELRLLVGRIAALAKKADKAGVQYGFVRGRSPVTCALAHVGHWATFTADISGCFDAIGIQHLAGKLPQELLDQVLVDGAPRQGLPTSPSVCNLALASLDEAIVRWSRKCNKQIIYTRYADDITVSCDDQATLDAVRAKVPQIVSGCGFKLSPRKTRTYLARGGMRPVVGVAVGDGGVHPTRKAKRRLRAAEHQVRMGVEGAVGRRDGLAEWCRLRPPRERRPSMLGSCENPDDELAAVMRAWKLPVNRRKEWPEKAERWLAPNVVITGDPVMVLGMSTWTTGWTSCMRQPSGQYRKGVLAWAALKGTRVAALLGDRKLEIAGVSRVVMRARTLVHELRDEAHTLVHDRVYGDAQSAQELQVALAAVGVISVGDARSKFAGVKVVGNVSKRYTPYLDNLLKREAQEKGKKVWIFQV